MAWSLPDKGEGENNLQSVIFQEYLEVLVEGISGKNCVLSGCAVTTSSLLTVAIAKGAVLTNGVLKAIAATTKTHGTADVTNPRLDLVVVDSAGALQIRAGTAAANPKPPARTANDVVLAVIYIPALLATIVAGDIVDLRMPRERGPLCVYCTTTAETTNTTAAAVNVLDKANAGVVIPDGLFLAGRTLRVRIGGNFLLNSGTPTLTLTIIYGGTTMFADVTVASLADADRIAWRLEFDLIAQGNSDQALSGSFAVQPIEIARVAPTSGIAGDLALANASNRLGIMPFAGSAAVDSNAANRTLQVQITMSVSNAADEIVVEGATVELI